MSRAGSAVTDVVLFPARRWVAIGLVVVAGSGAALAVLRTGAAWGLDGRGLDWLWTGPPLVAVVVPALVVVGLLLGTGSLADEQPIHGPVLTDEQFARAPRVDVVDGRGVADALAHGRVPVLCGRQRITLVDGGIEVRHTASVQLRGAARAVLRDDSSADAAGTAHVALHDRSRVVARGAVHLELHDKATAEAEGHGVRVDVEGSAQVEVAGGTVTASGRSGVHLSDGGRCTATQEATVVLADGLVEAHGDAHVLALVSGTGVVAAHDRVVVRHAPGVRVVAAGSDVHVVSAVGPTPFDRGPATWFGEEVATDAAAWARAWRVPVVRGHVALAIAPGTWPPVTTVMLPTLADRPRAIELPRPTWAFPLRHHAAMTGPPTERHLIVWVPLDAVLSTSSAPAVQARAVVADGAAWLDVDGLPAAGPGETPLPGTVPGTALASLPPSLAEALVHHFAGQRALFAPGPDVELGAGWSVKWLPTLLDPRPFVGRSAWWDVLLPDRTPDGRSIVVDRMERQVFVSGPRPGGPRPDWWLALAVVAGVAVALAGAVSTASVAVDWAAGVAGTVLLSAGVLQHLVGQRWRWYRLRWWNALAATYQPPPPAALDTTEAGQAPGRSPAPALRAGHSAPDQVQSEPTGPSRRGRSVDGAPVEPGIGVGRGSTAVDPLGELDREADVGPVGPGDGVARAQALVASPMLRPPGAGGWLVLVVGAFVAAFCIGATAASIAASSTGSAVVDMVVGSVAVAAVALAWRPRRDRLITQADVAGLPTLVDGGGHELTGGRHVVAGPADVRATGVAEIVLAAHATGAVQVAGYANVDQRGGQVSLRQHAIGVVRDGFASCADHATVEVWNGSVHAAGDSLVLLHRGRVSAHDRATVIVVPDPSAPGSLEVTVGDATVTVLGDTTSAYIDGAGRPATVTDVMPRRSDGEAAALRAHELGSGGRRRLPQAGLYGPLLEEVLASGVRPVARSGVEGATGEIDVVRVDGRLALAPLARHAELPLAVERPGGPADGPLLWFPAAGLALASGPARRRPLAGRLAWLLWLVVPLASLPLTAAAVDARHETDLPVAVVVWSAVVATAIVAATLATAWPWWRRLLRREAAVRTL